MEKRLTEADVPRLTPEEFWELNERVRIERIRNAAKRPLGENLAAGMELSELAMQLAASLQRSR